MKFMLCSAFSILMFAAGNMQAQTESHFIEMTGTAEVTIKPDNYSYQVYIMDPTVANPDGGDYDPAEYNERVKKAYAEGIRVLADIYKELKIKDAQVTTNDANVSGSPYDLITYAVATVSFPDQKSMEQFSSKIEEAERYRGVVAAATSTKMKEEEMLLYSAALEDARKRAEATLKGQGYKVGQILSVTEQADYTQMNPYYSNPEYVPPYNGITEYNKIKLNKKLTVRFEIVKN